VPDLKSTKGVFKITPPRATADFAESQWEDEPKEKEKKRILLAQEKIGHIGKPRSRGKRK